MTRFQRGAVEAVGTAFLLAAVVGSGIMGERLAQGNTAIALLANSLATGGALVALIVSAGPISGAHFNPAVTLMLAIRRQMPWADVPVYVIAQLVGALFGVIAAHAMFELPLLEPSHKLRAGPALMFSEFVATAGLLLVVAALARSRSTAAPYAVAGYIVGAYWFTASTSFANPAVTMARSLTDTFSGIAPENVAGFMAAQILAVLVVATIIGREQIVETPTANP